MTAFFAPAPLLVAGPCALERDAVNRAIAEAVAEVAAKLGLRAAFKGSFDKANRAGGESPRGPGLEAGLAALARVRESSGLPVLTDVHEPGQVPEVSAVVDAIQVPALLARQTDLIRAAAGSGCALNIKKGQSMAAADMAGAVAKARRAGATDLAVTERGTFFGYGDLVVDMRNLTRLRSAGVAVLFDATHAVQQPGRGRGGSSGGEPDLIPTLLRAAAAAGADGFYLETHPDPASAPSDAAVMWPLDRLAELLEPVVDIWHTANRAHASRAS